MNEDIAREVQLSREMIAKLNASDWQAEKTLWVGRLESRLEMLCDAIESASQQDTESEDGNG